VLAGGNRDRDVAVMGAAIERAIEQLDLDIANLRGLITELRPAALDQLGLEPALLALVDRLRASGLDIDASIELASEAGNAPRRLTPELETAVYRLVQESLTNAVKHGAAGRAVVEVDDSGQQLRVIVRDDGTGFDPQTPTGGFGLVGMRERAELLGGDLQIESSPGAGTTVTATLPVTRRDDDEPVGVAPASKSPFRSSP
jgi:signal transduction histidine kinase